MRIRTWYYSSMEPLYRGHLGVVHKARCESKGGRFDAVTLIDPSLDYDAVIASLDARIARVGELRSPLLRRDRGLVEVGGRLALSSVLVDGVPLRLLVEGQPLPPRVACGIAGRIALALHTAFDRLPRRKRAPYQLVHGDLSPADILVGPAGDLRVAGVAYQAGRLDYATDPLRSHLTRPSPWTAPESANGEVGHGADVYGVAAILAWMLTGRPPGYASADAGWHEGSVSGTAQQVREATGESALAELVAWCMSHDPGGRPRAEEVHSWLARLDASLGGPEWSKWVDRRLERVCGIAAEALLGLDAGLDDPHNAPSPSGLWTSTAGVLGPSVVDLPRDNFAVPALPASETRRTVASVVVDPARRARDLGLMLPRAESLPEDTDHGDAGEFGHDLGAQANRTVQIGLPRAGEDPRRHVQASLSSPGQGFPALRAASHRLEAKGLAAAGADHEEVILATEEADDAFLMAGGAYTELRMDGGEGAGPLMGGDADEALPMGGEADGDAWTATGAYEELRLGSDADEALPAAGVALGRPRVGGEDDGVLALGDDADEALSMEGDEDEELEIAAGAFEELHMGDEPDDADEELIAAGEEEDDDLIPVGEEDDGLRVGAGGASIGLSLGAPRAVGAQAARPSGGTVRVQLGASAGASTWNRDDLSDVELPSHLFPDRPDARSATAAVPLPKPPLRGVRITMAAPESSMDGFVFEGSEHDAIEATRARGRGQLRSMDEGDAADEWDGEHDDAEAEEADTQAVQPVGHPPTPHRAHAAQRANQRPTGAIAPPAVVPHSRGAAGEPSARPAEPGGGVFLWAVGLASGLILVIMAAHPLIQSWRNPGVGEAYPVPDMLEKRAVVKPPATLEGAPPVPARGPVEPAASEPAPAPSATDAVPTSTPSAASTAPPVPRTAPSPAPSAARTASPPVPATPPPATAAPAPVPATPPPAATSSRRGPPPSPPAKKAPAATSTPWSRPSSEPAEVPQPQEPAEVPQTPEPSAASTPWSGSASSEPVEATPPAEAASSPSAASSPWPMPSPSEPDEASPPPEPTAEPAADSSTSATPMGQLVVRGDASSVRIVADGNVFGAGAVPVGKYRIMASFGPGMPSVDYGSVRIAEGRTAVVACNATFMACKVR